MLQKARNEQTLLILDRLRKQGAPPVGARQGTPLMGEEEVDEEPDTEEEELSPDPSGTVTDTGMPGLNRAKKLLKRRS